MYQPPYNGNLEWNLTIRDFQADPDVMSGPQDLLTVSTQIGAMQTAPLGEPGTQYDARSVFDSRPPNSFDATFSGYVAAGTGAVWQVLFQVPLGFRAAVREWQVAFDNPGTGPISGSYANLVLAGSTLPYNAPIYIGPGTSDPMECFFLAEEASFFGVSGLSNNIPLLTNVYVNMRANLIPVTLEQLAYAVENRIPGT